MHIIFWLEEGNYITAEELDQFICAELPDQYLSEKDFTGKAMVDEEVNQYTNEMEMVKNNQSTLGCSDIFHVAWTLWTVQSFS